MPRPDKDRVTQLPTSPDAVSKPQTTQVVAHPVETPGRVANDTTLNSLLTGLSQFNSGLTKYVEGQADRDLEAGAQSRADGSPLTENKGEWYQHGYMVMDGRVKGMQDGAALRAAYDTSFDKDGGNLDKFITEHWNKQTAGLQDKSFLTGYSSSFGTYAEQLRKDHAAAMKDQVVEKQRTNMMFTMDQTIRSFVDNGKPIDPNTMDSLKQQFKQYFGTGYGDFNEMMYQAITAIGSEGKPEVYQFTRQNNVDGTRGMYYIPKYRDKLAEGEMWAARTKLMVESKQYEMAQRERKDKQEAAILPLYQMAIDGKGDDAIAGINKLVKDGIISQGSDFHRFVGAIQSMQQRELRADEEVQMTGLLAQVMRGQAGLNDILDSGLPGKAQRQLLTDYYSAQARERSLQASGATAENRPFHSYAFQSEHKFLGDQLKVIPDPIGKFTGMNDFINGQRATAELELTEYVRDNGVKDLHKKALEIIDRHQKLISAQDEATVDRAAKMLRYPTIEQANQAAESGLMSKEDYAMHVGYFKQHNNAKSKSTKGATK